MLVRAAIALCLSTAAALAAPAPMTEVEKATFKRHCTGDYLSYCNHTDPDGPEVSACFKANRPRLNPNCRAAMDAYAKSRRRG